MNFAEEENYIKALLLKYVDIAKDQYNTFAKIRENKYKYTKQNGKEVLGSHPEAIKYHMEDLRDSVFSSDKDKVAQSIIDDSNIQEEYKQAFEDLSDQGQDKLIDEVIKAEIELLWFDGERNKQRTSNDHIEAKYIQDSKSQSVQPIQHAKSTNDKPKEEIYQEYIEIIKDQKKNQMDKITNPIETLLQASNKVYLSQYTPDDYKVFFQALIYTPKHITQKKKLFKEYNGNYIKIANDFKEELELAEDQQELQDTYGYILELQSYKNVAEKWDELDSFLNHCMANDYITKNYLTNNATFAKKRFDNILSSSRKRVQFNDDELKEMFKHLADHIETYGFMAEETLIPVIGLYSGMRLEEICKLKIEDLKLDEKEQIWYFDINGEVKTDNSIRKVPIHSHLIDKFKLLDYMEDQKKKDQEMLFDLKTIKHKGKIKYNHYFVRDFFSKFRDNFVSQERRDEFMISFHSFRHCTASRLRRSSSPERVDFFAISNILGHSIDTTLKNYFELERSKISETPRYTEESLKLLSEDIEKLYLDDIIDQIEKFLSIYDQEREY
jgi:integrase